MSLFLRSHIACVSEPSQNKKNECRQQKIWRHGGPAMERCVAVVRVFGRPSLVHVTLKVGSSCLWYTSFLGIVLKARDVGSLSEGILSATWDFRVFCGRGFSRRLWTCEGRVLFWTSCVASLLPQKFISLLHVPTLKIENFSDVVAYFWPSRIQRKRPNAVPPLCRRHTLTTPAIQCQEFTCLLNVNVFQPLCNCIQLFDPIYVSLNKNLDIAFLRLRIAVQ